MFSTLKTLIKNQKKNCLENNGLSVKFWERHCFIRNVIIVQKINKKLFGGMFLGAIYKRIKVKKKCNLYQRQSQIVVDNYH